MESMPVSLVVEFRRPTETLKTATVRRRLTAAILLPALIGSVGSAAKARAAAPNFLQVSSP
jgi:hypothetical protein